MTRLPGGGATPLPAGAVRIDRRANQMTIRVPRALMDPKRATWRYVAGAGLWSGSAFQRPSPGAPGVFNLAFRFDEPQPIGTGHWFERAQAAALGDGTSGAFHADVDYARLARRTRRWIHAPGLKQARIYPSRLRIHEGVRSEFPQFGGRLQPYLVFVPKTYARTRRAGITFALHSLSATYTQFPVYSPNQQRQLGDDEGRFFVTPLARGPNGWYAGEAEVDFFEVWADLARHFRLDPRRVALSGYSMGGYGTYKLGLQWPDLFGAAFTTVGPPLLGSYLNTLQLVDNARWVPFLNWAGRTDALVPIGAVRAQQQRFDDLGLRSSLWTYPGGHYDFAARDVWDGARSFLAASVVQRDPNRVDYAFVPSADRRRLGIVHDHAYWVSHLRARDGERAAVSARSLAFGRGFEPITKRVTSSGEGLPEPESVTGTEWERIPRARERNALWMHLDNVRRAHIDGRRARLRGDRCLAVTVSSDGPAVVRIAVPFGARATARRGGGCSDSSLLAREVAVTRGGATIHARRGTHAWVILRD